MTMIPTSPPRNARSARRFSTGHGGDRSNTIPASQFVHQSSSTNADRRRQSRMIIYRSVIDHHTQPARPRRLHPGAPPAALQSP
jgi:hypothetical protein